MKFMNVFNIGGSSPMEDKDCVYPEITFICVVIGQHLGVGCPDDAFDPGQCILDANC
ncbi:MAG: hypothetical protein JW759_00830 [Candidatus Coatesbacteria bacterium]|nr:hypothetical protein [Candidatus Coatesbacteria bacterium]